MSRYEKYLKIVDECDRCMEQQGMKLLEGKVTMDNLEKIEKVLCIMEKAWCVAWQIDRLDDIHEAMSALAKHGSGPEKSDVKAMIEGGARSEGNDFRHWGGHTESEARSGGYYPPDSGEEEARRGRRRAYRTRSEKDMTLAEMMQDDEMAEEARRRRRRYRAMLDAMDAMELAEKGAIPGAGAAKLKESDFWGIPFMWPYASRMGYDQNPHMPEQNSPYNTANTLPAMGEHPAEKMADTHMPQQPHHAEPPRSGVVHAPVQTGATANKGGA